MKGRLLTCFCAFLLTGLAHSQEPEQLPSAETQPIVITGQSETDSSGSQSGSNTAEQKRTIPGGFTVKSAAEMELGRASNFEDLLRRSPGVFLQSDHGTEVSKISIRGSGILSEDEPLSVQFMQDGLTINQGDGEAILEDIDLATVKSAEIFRGANALRYGSLTLGGAINLVTLTGREADPFSIRLEGGSFGYFRGQLVSAGYSSAGDYIASLMGTVRDGFRDHSEENGERFFADLGYALNEHLENRFYLTLGRVDRQVPGGLTKEQMNDDPEQANENAINQDFNKAWQVIRIADKITCRTDKFEFDAGFFWFHRNFEERGLFEEDFRQGITAFYSDNYGISVNLSTDDELWGQKNIFRIGFNAQIEQEVSQNFENHAGHRGSTTALDTNTSINMPLYFEDQLYLTDSFSILAGMQAIYAQRHFRDDFVNDDQGDQSHRQDFYGWNPKVGLIYEFGPKNQIFGNFSGSWQPPSFNNLVEFTEGINSSLVYTPLEPQRAKTLEIGTRGEHGRFDWELAFYHTWLRNELLELNDANGNNIGAVNVDRSYHQGVEIGLEVELLDSQCEEDSNRCRNRLTLSQSYTLNDFHFDQDPVYGSNQIAGIPMHFYEAQLLFRTAAGFYFGPDLQCNLNRYPVDEANTLFADAYALLGFKIGYQSRKGPSVFLEAKNLLGERFPSAIDPIADARTVQEANIFHPGDGRAFYGGISWRW